MRIARICEEVLRTKSWSLVVGCHSGDLNSCLGLEFGKAYGLDRWCWQCMWTLGSEETDRKWSCETKMEEVLKLAALRRDEDWW